MMNKAKASAVLVGWVTLLSVSASAQGIASKYLRDKGIAGDPATIFHTDFEGVSVANITGTIFDWYQAGNGVELRSTVPPDSGGSKSLYLKSPGTKSVKLWKVLRHGPVSAPVDYEQIYVRYYVRYESGNYHHSGVHVGGDNATDSNHPYGMRGWASCCQPGFYDTNGNKQANSGEIRWFWLGPESISGRLDVYGYWFDMPGKVWTEPSGQEWGGDAFFKIPADRRIPDQAGSFMCVESMLKMNSKPRASSHDGEYALWVDGTLHGKTKVVNPQGYWGGNYKKVWYRNPGFYDLPGIQYTDRDKLGFAYVRIQNYDALYGYYIDDLVVATQRIGCLNTSSLSTGDSGGPPNADGGPVAPADDAGSPAVGDDARHDSAGPASVDATSADPGEHRGDDSGCACALRGVRGGTGDGLPGLVLMGLALLGLRGRHDLDRAGKALCKARRG
jgi:hypothetical protein